MVAASLAESDYRWKLIEAAWHLSSNSEPFSLADGDTLTFNAEDPPKHREQTATFNSANFADISAAMASEVNNDTTGVTATDYEHGGNHYAKIKSDQGPCTGFLHVTGGTANAALDFDTNPHYAEGWSDMYSGATVLP